MDDFASQQRPRRRNLTDQHAKLMKGRQGIVASYNAQAMVSSIEHDGGATRMLVTAVEMVEQASDNGLMISMMKGAEEKAGTIAGMTLADAGILPRTTWTNARASANSWQCRRRGKGCSRPPY